MTCTKKEIIDRINSSNSWLVKAATHVPGDKITWSPGGKATSVLEIVRHCAGFPYWVMACIEAGAPVWDEKSKTAEFISATPTLDKAIAKLSSVSEEYIGFINKLPEASLTEKIVFPWETSSVAETLDFHYWNNTYHQGQINYIQLLLGDGEMHI